MKTKIKRNRVEILCDQEIVDRLDKITRDTGTSRNFLIRKSIRLYLDNRDKFKIPVKTQI